MNHLISWKKSLSVCTESQGDPVLSVQDAINRAMGDFYNYFDVINSKKQLKSKPAIPEIKSDDLNLSINVVIAAHDK